MDFEWLAFSLNDVTWISLTFALGFLAKQVNLPPLVGFLVTGFVLHYFGINSDESLQKLADLGITLLLFTVGLKLNLKIMIRPQVWAVTILHTSLVILFFGLVILAFSSLNIAIFSDLDLKFSLMLAFALSFSSTVFVVKSLEAKSEMNSLHGQIAIGILVMQDLIAVIFLAASTGEVPTEKALLLFLLLPIRPLLHKLLANTGHGELLILYALVLALGGAELFELAGVKGDLGALIMGILISTHPKSNEMAKSMLGLKDLFLIGFFLSIGLSGALTIEILIIGLLLVPFIFIKSGLFYILMTRYKLRARTSLLATINLTNYSEFGLIIVAIGVSNNWLSVEWLTILAIAMSFSFIVAALLSSVDNKLYGNLNNFWMRFQSKERLPDDTIITIHGETIAIFGMGRIGCSAYDRMCELHGSIVIGMDFDAALVELLKQQGRKVLHGDPSDTDFWEKVDRKHSLEVVMLALPKLSSNLDALAQLKQISFAGKIIATARYPDEVEKLIAAGATDVFDMYTKAGAGFAEYTQEKLTS